MLHAIALAVAWCVAAASGAAEIRAGPHDYRDAVKKLRPGDTLRLASGVYGDGLDVHGLEGTKQRPIAIVGATGAQRTVMVGKPTRNTISIVDAAFVRIADIDLDGHGLDTDGVKAEGHAHFAHDIVLERLRISGFSGSQQSVGISTKCPAWNFTIRDVRIHDVGTGIYLGDSDGSAPFVRGIIERSTITATIGYSLQIKHQKAWPEALAALTGNGATIIRNNTFAKDGANATGSMARPNVLLGHWPLAGRGARERYLVYKNVFLDNPTEALLQAEGNVEIYDNTLVNRSGPAIVIRAHNDRPRSVTIQRNTIVARDLGIVLRDANPAYRQVVSRNAIFSSGVVPAAIAQGNTLRSFDDAPRKLSAMQTMETTR